MQWIGYADLDVEPQTLLGDMIALPPRPRVLVIALRRLGDVLLTTPLIRSVKRSFPDANIDALVFAGTEGILAGNPDLATVIAAPARASAAESLALAAKLWRRYDLAISTQTGDRPTFLAWLAGRISAGLVAERGGAARLKRWVLHHPVAARDEQHRITEILTIGAALGLAPVDEVVCPAGAVRTELAPRGDYAVIHAGPMFRYKQWTVAGWRALAAGLRARGLAVLATGGPSAEDRRYLDAVWDGADVQRIDGIPNWAELAALIRGARLYVGPDTSVTHLAAATGTPTIALYGPTDPRRWGPRPAQGSGQAWAPAGTIQQRGNVWLVQNPLPCLPCQLEGCERRLDSYSQCLDELSVDQVLIAVDQALRQPERQPVAGKTV